jgi:hypothetical protein
MSTWFHFKILPDTPYIALTPKEEFGERPVGASPAKGNPYTPWFDLFDHMDDIHIHISAKDEASAKAKAFRMYLSEDESITPQIEAWFKNYINPELYQVWDLARNLLASRHAGPHLSEDQRSLLPESMETWLAYSNKIERFLEEEKGLELCLDSLTYLSGD